MVYNAHGNYVVSSSKDGTVKLWDALSGSCVKTIVPTLLVGPSNAPGQGLGLKASGQGLGSNNHLADMGHGEGGGGGGYSGVLLGGSSSMGGGGGLNVSGKGGGYGNNVQWGKGRDRVNEQGHLPSSPTNAFYCTSR